MSNTATVDTYTDSPVRLRKITLADFGETLLAIRQGLRMQRSGWNGKDMYIALHVPTPGSQLTAPYIYMKTAQGTRVPWLASQDDLLAADWRTI